MRIPIYLPHAREGVFNVRVWISVSFGVFLYGFRTLSFTHFMFLIQYQGFTTYTAHALNKTILYDLGGPNSRYPEAQRVIILMTDGKATDAA